MSSRRERLRIRRITEGVHHVAQCKWCESNSACCCEHCSRACQWPPVQTAGQKRFYHKQTGWWHLAAGLRSQPFEDKSRNPFSFSLVVLLRLTENGINVYLLELWERREEGREGHTFNICCRDIAHAGECTLLTRSRSARTSLAEVRESRRAR